jgi:glyoxylase-like metal-dependent hydrolase (beta-lactamase superfamily II)
MTAATPQRLYLMRVATMYAGEQAVPVTAYLIRLTDGTHILVDSGFAADIQSGGGMRIEVERDIVAQLADLGLRPDAIDIVGVGRYAARV